MYDVNFRNVKTAEEIEAAALSDLRGKISADLARQEEHKQLLNRRDAEGKIRIKAHTLCRAADGRVVPVAEVAIWLADDGGYGWLARFLKAGKLDSVERFHNLVFAKEVAEDYIKRVAAYATHKLI